MIYSSRWFFGMPLCCCVVLMVVCSAANAKQPIINSLNNTVQLGEPGRTLSISLNSPTFTWDDGKITGNAPPLHVAGTFADGQLLEVSYGPISTEKRGVTEVKLFLSWSEKELLLRKWASIRLDDTAKSSMLHEVVLDRIDVQGRPIATHGRQASNGKLIFSSSQSHPVFMPGIFVGIEFPAASTRCEARQIVLAHRPGVSLQPGKRYETRKAVYGVAAAGEEVQAFLDYISLHHPKPHGFHINYNSWWTSHYPDYTEQEILDLMKVWEAKLWKSHNVALDSFCIDLGWSNKESIWEIDRKGFPKGFTNLQAAAHKMHSNLGLWISPSSCYSQALDLKWAKDQGYEVQPRPIMPALCLGGPRYSTRFQRQLSDLLGRYGISHVKMDGISLECLEIGHGHQPGALSCEIIAEGMIAAMEAARKVNPNVWLEPTCFGFNPSPWWLFYGNSVMGTIGDDAPIGRVPSPLPRESYTTARDFFNLQGASLLPIPINAQEVLGIIHQSQDPMMNDAVMTVLRGNMFLPLYVNPKFMNDARWDALAGLLQWARKNEEVLKHTIVLLPASWQPANVPLLTDNAVMPREPYGYAHVKDRAGLVALRNPWISPQTYTLKLDGSLGFSPSTQNLSAVCLYPEPRLYGRRLRYGDTLKVALAPYETVVLAFNANQTIDGLPLASDAVGAHLKVGKCECKLQHTMRQNTDPKLGQNHASLAGGAVSAVQLTCNANVHVTAPCAELLVLYEGKKLPEMPVGTLAINGRKVEMGSVSSTDAWSASQLPIHEHWRFLRAPLSPGDNAIALEQAIGNSCALVSVWVWAIKPGDALKKYPNALPLPESLSLDGVMLMGPTDVSKRSEEVRLPR